MAEIVTFVPQIGRDAQANMTGFIDLCRTKLTVFGQSLAFDDDSWDVSDTIRRKGKHNPERLVFSNLETSNERPRVMMSEPFKSFAKSYMRYQQAMRPTSNVAGRMAALRALEAGLAEMGTADPVQTDSHVLNRAAQLLKARLSAATAYRTVGQLEMLVDFLSDNAMLAVPTHWRNPVKRPSDSVRVGKEADERRAEKMPTQTVLDALPKVFRLATEPADVLVSSAAAVLCSAPDRVNELLLLPTDCEVRKKRDESDDFAYGLRWWPAKGAEPMVKWIVPSMSSVVEEAIEKIRKVTDEARKVALWYEANPDKIYLGDEAEHLRGKETLSMEELSDILFADPPGRGAAWAWCKTHGLPVELLERKAYARFVDVQATVLKMLPNGFPVVRGANALKYSDALFVMQTNTVNAGGTRIRCVIEPIGYPHIQNRLGARSTTGVKSIFDRCELYEPDGSAIRVNTHQFRHYLNTLAQTGGMSQLDIAKWSGRKDVRQNRYYDHETPAAVVARIRTAVGDDTRMFGPLATGVRVALISRDEFARLKVPTAHTTDFGYCIHDYVMSPCQMHRDCLNCGEQVCVKGHDEKEQRIRQAYTETTRLLAMAEKAGAEGQFGANDWVEHHSVQLSRIKALLEILDDPAVPSGAIIQLIPADIPSRLDQASQARALLPEPNGPRSPQASLTSEEVAG